MIDILKNNKNFLFFWLGQTISQFGDRIHTLAVIWLIYSWYNSGIIVGVVLIAATLPSFLLSPIAGNILDRYDRRKIMIICDIIRMLSVFVLSVLAFLNMINLTIIILITVIISIGSAFFNPATLAVIPSIVEEKQLLKANAFYQISASTSAAMGFIAGSGLISLIGVPIAFFVNAFSFLFSAYFLYKLNYKHIAFQSSTSFLEDFKEGWKASQQIPLIKHLFIPIIIINFFLAAFSILIPFLG